MVPDASKWREHPHLFIQLVRREELEANLASLRDPILTAEVFGVEEIIDPRDTRPLLVEFARRAYEIVAAENRGPKSRGMRP